MAGVCLTVVSLSFADSENFLLVSGAVLFVSLDSELADLGFLPDLDEEDGDLFDRESLPDEELGRRSK